jgi:hypothetical protein
MNMGNLDSLFNEKNKLKMGFWDYKTLPVGSRLAGTLICKRTVPDNYHPGQDQMVYDIKTETGDVMSVFGKPLIDNRMKAVRLGQFVAFEWKGEVKSKKPGMQPAKIVEVFSDPNLVDEAWLKDQEEQATINEIANDFNQPAGSIGTPPPVPTPVATPAEANISAKNAMIYQLAVAKIPGTTQENYKMQVMSFTKLAYIDTNLDEIIKALSA